MSAGDDIHVPFEALARVSVEGLAFVDRAGRIRFWNDAAAELTGVPAERAVGAEAATILRDAAPPSAAAKGEPRDVQVRLGAQDERTVRLRAVDIEDGTLVSFGPQRRYAQIENLKGEIVAAVSHELKTPIATIKAYATTLRENAENIAARQRKDYLKTIEEQADRLTHAVEDLLLAARVDVDYLLARRERVALDAIVDRAIEMIPEAKSTQRVERATKGVEVSGDPDLLSEVFAHLIENALKFSAPDALVRIEATGEPACTVVKVIDHGVGIAAEHVPYIFERFYRVEDNLIASTGGSGLGLYLARSVARAHGGSLGVQTKPGLGSTFTVTLPERA